MGAMKPYAAGSVDEDGTKAAAGDIDNEGGKPPKGSVDEGSDEGAAPYGRIGLAEKYARLESQVAKLARDNAAIKQQLDIERGKRTNAERYTLLSTKRQFYAFDLDREVARCAYTKMSDAQFTEHLEDIDANYRPIPDGELYVPYDSDRYAPDKPGNGREAFSKAHSDRALKLCEAAAVAGKPTDYESVLAEIKAGKL